MSVLEKIKNIVSEQLDINSEDIKPESAFVDDLGADSLDLTELIMAMEDEFDLEIDDEEAQNLRTVDDAIKYIEKHQEAS
jgi:acyl carrier protein